jgi:hypothetical protein
MNCGTCAKVRAHTPQAIRRRLEILERMMARKRQAIPAAPKAKANGR